MKKFYKLVSTSPQDGGYHILLDGRSVKTKSGSPLLAPNERVANAIVKEWMAQGDEIIPDTMPLTQILNTQMDRVRSERSVMMQSIQKYLDTDLICYIADVPAELVNRQERLWSPWREWFYQKFGVALETTSGLAALKQPVEAHESVGQYIKSLNDDNFTVLQLVTALSGSVILALAFVEGSAKAQDVYDASFVEEQFKDDLYDSEKYGSDPMIEKKQKAMLSDLHACEIYLGHS